MPPTKSSEALKLARLAEAVEEFLDAQRSSPEVHDWSACYSDEQVEKRIAKTKYSRNEAGCAYATLEEILEKCR